MSDDNLEKFFDTDERRAEARLNLDATIYIETESREPGDARPPEILYCEAVDLSANGMQVVVDRRLIEGAIHTLVVDIARNHERYQLISEVRWVRPHARGFLAGLSLYESDGSEIIDWKLKISRSFN
jgi:hypothetical protein